MRPGAVSAPGIERRDAISIWADGVSLGIRSARAVGHGGLLATTSRGQLAIDVLEVGLKTMVVLFFLGSVTYC